MLTLIPKSGGGGTRWQSLNGHDTPAGSVLLPTAVSAPLAIASARRIGIALSPISVPAVSTRGRCVGVIVTTRQRPASISTRWRWGAISPAAASTTIAITPVFQMVSNLFFYKNNTIQHSYNLFEKRLILAEWEKISQK